MRKTRPFGTGRKQGPLSAVYQNPARMILLSFFLVILVGTLLLMLPFSSRSGHFTSPVTALFTATSATCVTGLVVVDTYAYWSTVGQVIIMLLIQIGGVGIVTVTTFFTMLAGRKMGFRSMQIVQESINVSSFINLRQIVRMVFAVCFLTELCGFLLLACSFVPEMGYPRGLFNAMFLSISSFCNAGFDTLGLHGEYASLTGFVGNFNVNVVCMLLVVFGGLGFMVWYDLINWRPGKKLTLHTRMVLAMSGVLLLLGAVLILMFEWSNPRTLGELPLHEKVLAAFFQSVSCRTAGYNTVDIGGMHDFTKILMIVLMFIGASPGSTGGGIKVTTLAVVVMTVVSVVTGKEVPVIRRRRLSQQTVYKSIAIISLSLLVVVVMAGMLILTEQIDDRGMSGVDAVFEAVSAFATVGLSTGITGISGTFSRLLLSLMMFIGRLGPVSFALSIMMRPEQNRKEILPEANIMVG